MISPPPPDPPTPSTTPAYLIGLTPSPSDTSQDTGGVIAPLGGGTTNTGPSPNSGSGGGSNASNTLNSGGPPLPLLVLGLVIGSGIAGFALWRYAPRGKELPAAQAAPPLMFTPYGSDTGPTTLVDPAANRPPRD